MSLPSPIQRILVTGGAGFIGSHLVRRLASDGFQVHVLHRPGSDLSRIGDLVSSVQLWPCDLLDVNRLREVLESVRPEVIYHLAADVSFGLRHFDPALAGVTDSIERNIRSSLNLFVVAAAMRLPELALLIRLGGIEEYGRGPLPFEESQREQPVSPYSASQVAVTHYLQMAAPHLAFRAITIRPAVVYGPGQSSQFLIPSLIEHCLQGRDFPLGSKAHGRDFVYVDDLVDALLLLLTKPVPAGEIINISGGSEHVIGEVASLIVHLTGARIKFIPGTPVREKQVAHLCLAGGKARRILDWEPVVNLETGLRRTIEWFREQAKQ